jgi:hypothetical protein
MSITDHVIRGNILVLNDLMIPLKMEFKIMYITTTDR